MTSSTILTATGTHFDFERLEPFDIEAIVHALSHLCRFTGHTRRFYSVAQHSVLVSYVVPPHLAFHALMHDAAEAYTGDVSRPLKKRLPDFQAIEREIEARLFPFFGLSPELPPEVIHADLVLLATEKRDLMPRDVNEWGDLTGIEPLAVPIDPVMPARARDMFWARWHALKPRGAVA